MEVTVKGPFYSDVPTPWIDELLTNQNEKCDIRLGGDFNKKEAENYKRHENCYYLII